MPRIPRKLLVDPTEVGVFHCISRCVRRAFLCGEDRLTGKNFEHRRQWLQERLAYLAGQFGVDVLGFAVMSNHLHVILRTRPDVVRGWSDAEVARRWWNLFPLRRDEHGEPAVPDEWELSLVTASPERVAEIRRRLASLSWFMRCLAEPIARRANREDGCTGRFWEGRYKCQPLLDEAALAACLAYVDLNPLRAGVADTPETSRFTSLYERCRAQEAVSPGAVVPELTSESHPAGEVAWLAPFELSGTLTDRAVPPGAGRASNRGCLPMRFSDYRQLIHWTASAVRPGRQETPPSELTSVLGQLRITSANWLELVTRFGRLFRRSAGRPESLRQEAHRWGRRRSPGITHSLALFG